MTGCVRAHPEFRGSDKRTDRKIDKLWFLLLRAPLDLKSFCCYGCTILRSVQIFTEQFIGQMYQYFLCLKFLPIKFLIYLCLLLMCVMCNSTFLVKTKGTESVLLPFRSLHHSEAHFLTNNHSTYFGLSIDLF